MAHDNRARLLVFAQATSLHQLCVLIEHQLSGVVNLAGFLARDPPSCANPSLGFNHSVQVECVRLATSLIRDVVLGEPEPDTTLVGALKSSRKTFVERDNNPSLNNPNGTAAVHMLTPGQWRTADNLLKGTMSPDPYMYAGPGSAFGGTYSTCWYAIKELVDLMAVARQEVPPLGLLEMVVPGTKMAGWIDMAEQRHCQNSTCCPVGGCDPITVAN